MIEGPIERSCRTRLLPSLLAGGLVACAAIVMGSGFYAQRQSPDPDAAAQVLEQRLITEIVPILSANCMACHGEERGKGGVRFHELDTLEEAVAELETLLSAHVRVAAYEMPPEDEDQPTDEQRAALLTWIDDLRRHVQPEDQFDPGWFATRRLNKDEYRYTLRDLLGIDPTRHDVAERLPGDDLGYGFNTIADVLTVSTLHVETYLAAAENAIDLALGPVVEASEEPVSLAPLEGLGGGRPIDNGGYFLFSNGSARGLTSTPAQAEYEISVRAWGTRGGDELPNLSIRVDGRPLGNFPVEAVNREEPQVFTVRTVLEAGPREIHAHFTNDFHERGVADRNLAIESISLAGPLDVSGIARTKAWKSIFIVEATTDHDQQREAARTTLESFADRAFRRPLEDGESDRLLALYESSRAAGDGHEQAVRVGLQAVLVSPSFLYRTANNPTPSDLSAVYTLNDHELATRLSYFIWSSMPDAELRRLADLGLLGNERVLVSQLQRMIDDPKADAFIESFAGQWLLLRNLEALEIDRERFSAYDDSLRGAMIQEVTLFFGDVVRSNRSIMDFVQAEDLFINQRLAEHYGLEGVRGDAFRRVRVEPDSGRGGILTSGAVLTVTSNPTRTSPVKRGLFVLDQLLGTPPPPPPPEIPPLEQTQTTLGPNATVREQLAAHLIDSTCASCHVRMDPIGLAMEHFDAVGQWRDEADGHPVDASGVLPGGIAFNGPNELKKILLAQDDQVVENVTRRLLTYVLGRGLEPFDRPTVDAIVRQVQERGNGFADLIEAVVLSEAFRTSRGRS